MVKTSELPIVFVNLYILVVIIPIIVYDIAHNNQNYQHVISYVSIRYDYYRLLLILYQYYL